MNQGKRFIVVGSSGSGKTTLAKAIAERLGLPHVELDSIHWLPDWQEAPEEEFIAKVVYALDTAGECWVMDGNYRRIQQITWQRADTIVWLDYSLWMTLQRLFRRTIRRWVTREELWQGNRENIREAFFKKDSLFRYMLKNYHRRKEQYSAAMQSDAFTHLRFVRLCNPRETESWLNSLAAKHDE